MKRSIALFLSLLLILTACGSQDQPTTAPTAQPTSAPTVSAVDKDDLFSDRDQDTTVTTEPDMSITFLGSSIETTAPGVRISGTTVTITRAGTHSFTL